MATSTSLPWTLPIQHASQTDIGLRRANNQDSYLVKLADTPSQWRRHGALFVVADGMGAHAAGEVASRIATEAIAEGYKAHLTQSPIEALRQSLYDAHHAIRTRSQAEPSFRGMGTTADALVLLPRSAIIGHVGDSRVYRLRNGVIEQLTADHSLVWEICKAGNLPYDQAPTYIPRNQITRSLGPTDPLNVDVEGPFPLQKDDTFLLCSDGLSGLISDSEMGQFLTVLSPDEAVESLTNLANLRGGNDNITVIVAKIKDVPNTPPSKPLPAVVWIGLGVFIGCVLGFLTSLATSWTPGMIVFSIAAVVFGVLFAVATQRYFFGKIDDMDTRFPQGQGPYVHADSIPEEGFADRLATILHQFRAATTGDKWKIRWETADSLESEGAIHIHKHNFSGAIRCYAQAINTLMRELKQQGVRK